MSMMENVSYKVLENHPTDSRVKICEDGVFQTLSSRMGTGGGNVPMVMENATNVFGAEVMPTPVSSMSTPVGNTQDGFNIVTASKASFMTNADDGDVAQTLVAMDYKDPQIVAYGLDRASFNQGKNAKFDFSVEEEKIGAQVARGPGAVCVAVDCRSGTENEEINGTLQAKSSGGFNYNSQNVCRQGYIVRRLTPLECERLQGFPDGWTDIGEWTDTKGKKHKDADSPRYKALGNSIALPFWEWMAERMVRVLKDEGVENPTMASLFDGIGGFPLVYSRCGCEPVWASEIEEFPIAVTKKRFPEDPNSAH